MNLLGLSCPQVESWLPMEEINFYQSCWTTGAMDCSNEEMIYVVVHVFSTLLFGSIDKATNILISCLVIIFFNSCLPETKPEHEIH